MTAIQRRAFLLTTLTVGLAGSFTALSAPRYLLVGDPEHYVELARHMARGEPYEVNQRREVKFPPGYPAALAPGALVSGGSFPAINRWAAILAAPALPLTWLWARRREPGFALAITVATILTVPFLDLATGNPMSEPLYLAATMGLLLWADGAKEPMSSARSGWGRVLLGCLLVIALPAVRTIGIAAVLALGLVMLFPPARSAWRRQGALPLAAGAAFTAAWLFWTQNAGIESVADASYLQKLLMVDPHHPDLGRASVAQLLGRISENLPVQTAHIGELLTPIPWIKPTWYSPFMLAIPLVLLGWWRGLCCGSRFIALYFACYLGILLLWPYDEGPRFLLVIAPLLWFYLLEGGRLVAGAIREDRKDVRMAGVMVSGVAVLVLLGVRWRTPADFTRQDLAGLGIWTVLLLTAVVGWKRLVRAVAGLDPARVRVVVTGAVALMAVGAVVRAGPGIVRRARGAPPVAENPRALWEAAAWISANTPKEAIIQSTYATRIHFATGRQTVSLPVTVAPEPFLEIARRYHPAFVIVLDSEDPYVTPIDAVRFGIMQRLFPSRFTRVHRFAGGSIYAFQ